jgi:hypothetical protein
MSKDSIIRYCILIFILIALAASASAQDLPFSTEYDEDFIEGESVKKGFGELDKLIFTYMGENHTFRLMSFSEETSRCDIVVDKKGTEIADGETVTFALLPGSVGDLDVKLLRVDDDSAVFRLTLSDWLVQDDDDGSNDDSTNATNTTAANSTNTTAANSTSPANSTNASSSSSNNAAANQQSSNSNQESSNNNQQSPAQQETSQTLNAGGSSYIGGGTIVNINFNITLPQGSGVGFLIIVAIVLGGLLVYKKLKKRMTGEDVLVYKGKKKKR